MAVILATFPAVTVTLAGVAERANGNHIAVTSLTIQAETDNAGSLYIGDSTVTAANGIEVVPGGTVELTADSIGRGQSEEFFVDEVWINATSPNDEARVVGWRRRSG